MTDQTQKLKDLHSEISKEEGELKFEMQILKDRKKNLEMLKQQYFNESLEALESK